MKADCKHTVNKHKQTRL